MQFLLLFCLLLIYLLLFDYFSLFLIYFNLIFGILAPKTVQRISSKLYSFKLSLTNAPIVLQVEILVIGKHFEPRKYKFQSIFSSFRFVRQFMTIGSLGEEYICEVEGTINEATKKLQSFDGFGFVFHFALLFCYFLFYL